MLAIQKQEHETLLDSENGGANHNPTTILFILIYEK